LYAAALECGITIRRFEDNNGAGDPGWPDDEVLAWVEGREERGLGMVLAPGSDAWDEEAHAALIAMGTALAASLHTGPGEPQPGFTAAPAGMALITRERVPEPPTGAGRLAGYFARACGLDVPSATFRVITEPS
jgi:hypothetical protein